MHYPLTHLEECKIGRVSVAITTTVYDTNIDWRFDNLTGSRRQNLVINELPIGWMRNLLCSILESLVTDRADNISNRSLKPRMMFCRS